MSPPSKEKRYRKAAKEREERKQKIKDEYTDKDLARITTTGEQDKLGRYVDSDLLLPAALSHRYEDTIIERVVGQGTFSDVVFVRQGHKQWIVKIIRAVRAYRKDAQTEDRLLQKIVDKDPHDSAFCVRRVDSFFITRKGLRHFCIKFHYLGESFFHFFHRMREGRSGVSRGFNHVMAREFVGQLLVALDFCHQVLRIAHCDIKDENVMFCGSGSVERKEDLLKVGGAECRLIDFGDSLRFEDLHLRLQPASPAYRAPEVLLQQMPYSSKVDVWAVGCLAAQFLLAESLFREEATEEQRAADIVNILGKPCPSHAKEYRMWCSLSIMAKDTKHRPRPRLSLLLPKSEQPTDDIFPVIRRLLTLDPDERPSPAQALLHFYPSLFRHCTSPKIQAWFYEHL